MARRLLLGALFLALAGNDASAHTRSESYSNWQIHGDRISGVVTIAAGEVTRLVTPGNSLTLEQIYAAHLGGQVSVASASGDCEAAEPGVLQAARGFVRIEVRYACSGAPPRKLRYRAMFDMEPAHVHYARIYEDDRFVAEALLTDSADTWTRGAGGASHSFGAFLELGIRHIASGLDHIAFLLGMLLVAGAFGRSIVAVTGFTLGHSLSLGAAVLGYLQADSRLVEAFIGFTVALVAVEFFLMRRPSASALAFTAGAVAWATGGIALASDLIPAKAALAYAGFGAFAFCYLLGASRVPARGGRLGGAILFTATTCFGLIHGFGFAGFLMDTGITGSSLLLPLLGFNLGVEVGQLALLAVAFVGAYWLRESRARLALPLVAAGLCGIGVYWFVGRSLAA